MYQKTLPQIQSNKQNLAHNKLRRLDYGSSCKKGDTLFVGEDEDTLAVIVLDTVEYEGENYLKVFATPIMVEEVLNNPLTDTDYAREIADGDKYFLDPVVDPELVTILDEELKKKKAAEKTANTPAETAEKESSKA